MNEKVYKTLEYNKIIEKLTALASSSMAKEKCEKLVPLSDIDEIKLMQKNIKEAVSMAKGFNRLKVKVINSIDSKLDNLINMKIYKTEDHMNLFLENAREMVFGYYKSVNLKGFRNQLIYKEDKIKQIIRRIAIVENII